MAPNFTFRGRFSTHPFRPNLWPNFRRLAPLNATSSRWRNSGFTCQQDDVSWIYRVATAISRITTLRLLRVTLRILSLLFSFFFFFWTKNFSREYFLLFIVIGKLMSKNNFTILSPREISIRNAAKLELKTEKLDITLLKKYSTFRKIIENGRLTKVAQKFSLTQRFDKLRPAPCYARNTLIRSQTNVHRCNCPGTHDLILRIK